MSYEPTNWKSGDTVTSAKLNKMEQGIASAGGGGSLICNADSDTQALDKTAEEISTAFLSGTNVLVIRYNESDYKQAFTIGSVEYDEAAEFTYSFYAAVAPENNTWVANAGTDYPSLKTTGNE